MRVQYLRSHWTRNPSWCVNVIFGIFFLPCRPKYLFSFHCQLTLILYSASQQWPSLYWGADQWMVVTNQRCLQQRCGQELEWIFSCTRVHTVQVWSTCPKRHSSLELTARLTHIMSFRSGGGWGLEEGSGAFPSLRKSHFHGNNENTEQILWNPHKPVSATGCPPPPDHPTFQIWPPFPCLLWLDEARLRAEFQYSVGR